MKVSRIRTTPAGRDPYGDPIPGTETTTEIPGPLGFERAWTAPRTSADVNDVGRAGVIVGLTLFFRSGWDLIHTDLVQLGDDTDNRWRVDGEPGDWGPHPMTGWEPGATVALVRAEG